MKYKRYSKKPVLLDMSISVDRKSSTVSYLNKLEVWYFYNYNVPIIPHLHLRITSYKLFSASSVGLKYANLERIDTTTATVSAKITLTPMMPTSSDIMMCSDDLSLFNMVHSTTTVLKDKLFLWCFNDFSLMISSDHQ